VDANQRIIAWNAEAARVFDIQPQPRSATRVTALVGGRDQLGQRFCRL